MFLLGKFQDQSSLMIFDLVSAHNFILVELARKLGIQTEETGPALKAMGASKGQQVLVTSLIEKLFIHI